MIWGVKFPAPPGKLASQRPRKSNQWWSSILKAGCFDTKERLMFSFKPKGRKRMVSWLQYVGGVPSSL